MNVNQLIRIFLRHLWLLVSIPVLLAIIVAYFTKNQTYYYATKTKIYTGIASGINLEQNTRSDYFATNNTFDNLINVIKSRETLSETGIRLLAQGLILENYNPVYISKENFIAMRRMVPQYIKDFVVKPLIANDSLAYSIAFNKTVLKLTDYKNATDTNFIYNLLNYHHKHYSIYALSSVSVTRIQSSDILELKYESDDPGISLQTLIILTDVLIKNFRMLKENQSDVVVKYFQAQVRLAQGRLKKAEEKLLKFNTDNKIINYYEQSKFIAGKKEDIEEYIQNERIKMSGAEQALKKLEDKLQIQGQVQEVTESIVEKRNRLINITEKITINELYDEQDTITKNEIANLKKETEQIKESINHEIGQLYNFRNTIEGLPISNILYEWLKNLIIYAEAKAGLTVLNNRQQEFIKNYEIFAPLGATLKRIEREIDVSEREYLSLLHSLNLAKLKQQNEELSTNIKPLDRPYFPLTPKPSKRKILVIAAAFLGFIMVAFGILLAEYFDNTMKTVERAEKFTKLKAAGVMPRIIGKYNVYNLPFIINRLTELIIQEIKLQTFSKEVTEDDKPTKLITVFSPIEKEGKSFLAGKIVAKIRSVGEQVLYLNYTFKTPEELLKDKIQKNLDEQKEQQSSSGFKNLFSRLASKYTKLKQDDLKLESQNQDNLIYHIDETFSEKEEIFDLISNTEINTLDNFRYIILEIPAILYYTYPYELIKLSDMSLMIVRANREWKKSDEGALQMFEDVVEKKPIFILNGTDINEIEAILGTLPKKRSKFRRFIKQVLNLQFYTKQSLR